MGMTGWGGDISFSLKNISSYVRLFRKSMLDYASFLNAFVIPSYDYKDSSFHLIQVQATYRVPNQIK